jgi:putative ABC transport system ATP-binding protein
VPVETLLESGQVLFDQGARGELIYFIESGRVEVFRVRADGTEEHLAEVGAGNYVGELGPILNLPRSATARALERSSLMGYTVLAFRRQFPDAVPGKNASRASHQEDMPET